MLIIGCIQLFWYLGQNIIEMTIFFIFFGIFIKNIQKKILYKYININQI